eukprot:1159564-Pelagomonas_calceolata.AAC.8
MLEGRNSLEGEVPGREIEGVGQYAKRTALGSVVVDAVVDAAAARAPIPVSPAVALAVPATPTPAHP